MMLLLNPWAWLTVLLFSAVGTMGNLVEYYLGRAGADAVMARFPEITPDRWQRVEGLYEKHGAPLLLLSTVPGLGLAVCTVAGAVGIGRTEFRIWVFVGKLVRNSLLLLLISLGIDLFGPARPF